MADLQVENAIVGTTILAVARAKVNYQGGSGSAHILAEGRNQVPFRIAATADLTPQLWRIAAKGRANSLDFATAAPLRIVPGKTDYEILPGTLNIGSGNIKLAGRYGSGIELQSRLQGVNLAILNPCSRGWGWVAAHRVASTGHRRRWRPFRARMRGLR
ncbi:MAG: hypothetical protein HC788_03415 [Sphingopyxis sp.]|nr:hypothetical protein [Sphingopyxis sp.]